MKATSKKDKQGREKGSTFIPMDPTNVVIFLRIWSWMAMESLKDQMGLDMWEDGSTINLMEKVQNIIQMAVYIKEISKME